MELNLNGQAVQLDEADVPPDMPLLWVLRDVLNLTGTKFGCGVGACGACTVWVAGRAQRSCLVPVGAVGGQPVRTIESLGAPQAPHPLQRVWVEHQVPQCGYCQSGMLMAVAALLEARPRPTEAEVDAAITNLCRCGSTPRVRIAIRAVTGGRDAASPPARARPGTTRPAGRS